MTLARNQQILIKAGKKASGEPTLEESPGSLGGAIVGATTDAGRSSLNTTVSEIVYFNQTTGNDSTGDGTSGNPYLTYGKAATDIDGATKFTVEQQDDTALDVTAVTTQLQAAIGISPTITNSSDRVVTEITTSAGITNGIKGLMYDGVGTWVIGDTSGNFANSTDDGATWTDRTISAGWTGDCVEIAFGAGLFVAISSTGKSASSPDGITWTDRTLSTSIATDPLSITYSATVSIFVAVSDIAGIGTSPDGITWTDRTNPSSQGFSGVRYSDEHQLFIAVGGNVAGDRIFTSPDGITWIERTDQGTSDAWHSVANQNNRTIVSNINDVVVEYSDDGGLTWNTTSIDVPTPNGSIQVSSGGGRFLIYGIHTTDASRIVSTTRDGVTWRNETVPNTFINVTPRKATFGNGNFLIGFDSGKLAQGRFGFNINGGLCGYTFTSLSGVNLEAGEISNCTFPSDIPLNSYGDVTNCVTYELDEYLLSDISITQCDINATINAHSNFDVLTIENLNAQTTTTLEGNNHIISDSLFIGELQIDGFAAAQDEISITKCTLIGALDINNTGSTDSAFLEFKDNIVEGNITAESAMTLLSGNVRGTVEAGIIVSSNVRRENPLFINTTLYRLTYAVLDGGFDSPLVGASVFFVNGSGFPRDMGAWSYDQSSVGETFSRAIYVPKPEPKSLIFTKQNVANLQGPALSGAVDVFNDPDRATERLMINYRSVSKEILDFLDWFENNFQDMRVQIAIDPGDLTELPTATVNGAHSAGVAVLNITTTDNLQPGYRITVSNITYYILYTIGANPTTSVVLDRVLEESLSGAEVITIENPIELAEWHYIVKAERKYNRSMETSTEYFQGLKLEFIRQLNE